MTGLLAHLGGQPAWAIVLAALTALALVMVVAAALEHWRASRILAAKGRVMIDAPSTYDAELARLRALDRAKQQATRESEAARSPLSNLFDAGKIFSDMHEEAEARDVTPVFSSSWS